MPTPRVTTTRRVSRKPLVPAVPAVPKVKPGIISELAAALAAPVCEVVIDAAARRMMIAEAAYYCAEKRGFAPGGETQDWLEAEAQIRARFPA